MTYQELTDKIGSEQIFAGTEVDEVTQASLLEWLFDRYLSMEGNDTTKWLRQYRRNLNMFYPIYMGYVRVESIKKNFDPFIVDFMERLHEDSGNSTTQGSSSKLSQGTNSASDTTITDNKQVRTPDLTTAGQTGNTRTDEVRNSDSSQDSSSQLNNGSESSQDDGQTRGMSIAYPEANMGSIPSGIGGFPSSIEYAEGETDTFTQNIHSGSNQSNENSNATHSGSSTQNGTTIDTGTNNVHETGDETIDFDGSVIKTSGGNNQNSETGSNASSTLDNRKIKETEQGRHESVADIFPRAINTITSTAAIKWLVNSLQICFDNYDTI